MKKKFWIAILVAVLTVCAIPCQTVYAAPEDFEVAMSCGYGNEVEMNSYAPFQIAINNKGKDFEGTVQMIVPDGDGHNVMYEEDVSIAAGAVKVVTLTAEINANLTKVNIRIANKRGKVVWEETKRCTTAYDLTEINVGILSDDYSALGYMDRNSFVEDSSLSTRIIELDKDIFPTDWHALDMLDVIVISDFSTDLLTDGQIGALSLWVTNGGLLFVGTGSTATKTLSNINGTLLDVQTGDLNQYNTLYGLSQRSFYYGYNTSGSIEANPYYDSEYESFFESYFRDNREFFDNTFMEAFGEEYYYDPNYNTWDEYYEDSFYWFCLEQYYYQVYYPENGQESNLAGEIAALSYVKADILDISVSLDNTPYVFNGDTSDGKEYSLAEVAQLGDGYIVITSFDFTKTPFTTFDGNKYVFMDMIETLIGEKLYNEAYDYSYYSYSYDYDYDSQDLANAVGSANLPPLAIYLLIIGIYMVAILVVYLIFRKKRKTMKLWVVYPLVSIGVAILVFCIGFSTRLFRPLMDVATFVRLQSGGIQEENYSIVTVPGNDEYRVSYNGNYGLEYIAKENDYYYFEEEDVDYSQYDYAIKTGYDSNEIRICKPAALDKSVFYLDRFYLTDKTIDIKWDDTNQAVGDVSITNNYDCNLENAFAIMQGKVYRLGSIQAGDTIRLSQAEAIENYPMGYYSYLSSSNYDSLEAFILPERSKYGTLALAFGSLSSAYTEYNRRSAMIDFAEEEYDFYDYEDVYGIEMIFCAFTSEVTCDKLQVNTNYRERRSEMVIETVDFTNQLFGN